MKNVTYNDQKRKKEKKMTPKTVRKYVGLCSPRPFTYSQQCSIIRGKLSNCPKQNRMTYHISCHSQDRKLWVIGLNTNAEIREQWFAMGHIMKLESAGFAYELGICCGRSFIEMSKNRRSTPWASINQKILCMSHLR